MVNCMHLLHCFTGRVFWTTGDGEERVVLKRVKTRVEVCAVPQELVH